MDNTNSNPSDNSKSPKKEVPLFNGGDAEQEEIDRILDKISETRFNNINTREIQILIKASEKQRNKK